MEQLWTAAGQLRTASTAPGQLRQLRIAASAPSAAPAASTSLLTSSINIHYIILESGSHFGNYIGMCYFCVTQMDIELRLNFLRVQCAVPQIRMKNPRKLSEGERLHRAGHEPRPLGEAKHVPQSPTAKFSSSTWA